MKDLNLFPQKDGVQLAKITSKRDLNPNNQPEGYLITSSESEARRIIASLRDSKFKGVIALKGSDDAFNRRAIETLKIDYLILPTGINLKDTLKQRDSGLNHVVAKEAVRKGISLVIPMNEISDLTGKNKSLALSKAIQNIKICRKAKCKLKIASLANNPKKVISEIGRKSFGISLGMDSHMSRDAAVF
ncbi:MAG: hypothetical protein IH845_04240 [Nanoarchaeota archaeon]|nr:hypothetical protein [Nanoarchaeota archaeon]